MEIKVTCYIRYIGNVPRNFPSRDFIISFQKQTSRRVPRKRWSENMQGIYRRTTMPKWSQPYWKRTSAWIFSCKFAEYFKNTFSKEHFWGLFLSFPNNISHKHTKKVFSAVHESLPAISSIDIKINLEKRNFWQNVERQLTSYFILLQQ